MNIIFQPVDLCLLSPAVSAYTDDRPRQAGPGPAAGGGGAPRDSAGSGATEEGLTSRYKRKACAGVQALCLIKERGAGRCKTKSFLEEGV